MLKENQPFREYWLPPLLFLALTLAALGPGGYFLHHDTPLQNAGGADLVLGCWGPDGGKATVMLLEGIAYLIGGVNPVWDMVNLAILGAVMAFAFFRLAQKSLGSTSWALLGLLWLLSLPSILYYSHIHMGYPLAFFMLGAALYGDERYFYTGAAFSLAVLSHSSLMIPVGLWCLIGLVLIPGEKRLKMLLHLTAGFLIPYLLIEALRFFFTGAPFGWTRIIIGDILRQAVFAGEFRWSHVFELMAFSNSWINAGLLIVGAAYPLFRRAQRRPLMDQVYLTGWLMVAFYTYRVLTQGIVLPRMLTTMYALLAIPSLYVGMWLVKQVGQYRRVILAGLSLLVSWSLFHHVMDFAVFSRTGFNAVDQAMAQAAQAGMPVRYFGNMNAGLFFGLRHEVMVNVNELDIDLITGDTQAVLIFERVPNADLPVLDALLEGGFDRDYAVVTYPHMASYRPYVIETYIDSPGIDQLRALAYVRDDQAAAGEIQIWWPQEREGSFEEHTDWSQYIVTYSGEGCLNNTRFYRHIFAKLEELLP